MTIQVFNGNGEVIYSGEKTLMEIFSFRIFLTSFPITLSFQSFNSATDFWVVNPSKTPSGSDDVYVLWNADDSTGTSITISNFGPPLDFYISVIRK